jgi:hypothetical protein
MLATYDPFIGGGYDPTVWFIRMPYGIKMPEIKAIMLAIHTAVLACIAADNDSNLYVMVTAAETLTDTVNVAIRDYVKANNNV